jgi:hypothetical protein
VAFKKSIVLSTTYCIPTSHTIPQVVWSLLAPYRFIRCGWRHRHRLFRQADTQIGPWDASSPRLASKGAVNRSGYSVCIVLDAFHRVTWLVDWQAHVLVVRFVFLYPCHDTPLLTLVLDLFEVSVLLGACFLVNYVTADKKTNWIEGIWSSSFWFLSVWLMNVVRINHGFFLHDDRESAER